MTKMSQCILKAFVCVASIFFAIAEHHNRSLVDFASLATLFLESCAGLEETLTTWFGATHSFPQACIAPNLRSLTVRSETPGTGLQSQLELLICSLRGLTKSYILPKATMTMRYHSQTYSMLMDGLCDI